MLKGEEKCFWGPLLSPSSLLMSVNYLGKLTQGVKVPAPSLTTRVWSPQSTRCRKITNSHMLLPDLHTCAVVCAPQTQHINKQMSQRKKKQKALHPSCKESSGLTLSSQTSGCCSDYLVDSECGSEVEFHMEQTTPVDSEPASRSMGQGWRGAAWSTFQILLSATSFRGRVGTAGIAFPLPAS